MVVEVGLRCNREPDREIEVGETFRSIAWAECCTNINRGQIGAQLSGKITHARGVRFEYLNDENKYVVP